MHLHHADTILEVRNEDSEDEEEGKESLKPVTYAAGIAPRHFLSNPCDLLMSLLQYSLAASGKHTDAA